MQVFLFVLLILPLTVNSSGIFSNLFGHSSPKAKDKCPIKLYNPKDSSFTGLKLYASEEFEPLLITLSKYAKECRVKIQIKQSFMQENLRSTSLEITDRTELAFRLGEAIEFELVDQDKKLLCNRVCLGKELSNLKDLPDAKCFLEKISRNSDLRQDAFKPNLLIKQQKPLPQLRKLEEKRKEIQEKCSDLKIDS